MTERETLKAELREEIKAELLHEIMTSREPPIRPVTPHRKFVQAVNELFYQYGINIIRDYAFRTAINGAIRQIFHIDSMPNLKEKQLQTAINFVDDFLKLISEYRNEVQNGNN